LNLCISSETTVRSSDICMQLFPSWLINKKEVKVKTCPQPPHWLNVF
jgi:hypothetical protein